MPYSSSVEQNVACFTLEGHLDALDLLMMFRSPEYKSAIYNYDKVLIDYTAISGVSLTKDDIIAITIIGKNDLEQAKASHVVAAVHQNERALLEKISEKLFNDSALRLEITDSKDHAFKLLTKDNA